MISPAKLKEFILSPVILIKNVYKYYFPSVKIFTPIVTTPAGYERIIAGLQADLIAKDQALARKEATYHQVEKLLIEAHMDELAKAESKYSQDLRDRERIYLAEIYGIKQSNEELLQHNNNLITQIQSLTAEVSRLKSLDVEATAKIDQLSQENSTTKIAYNLKELEKSKLDEELLRVTRHLTAQSRIKDNEALAIARKLHYLTPQEGAKINAENTELQARVGKLDKQLAVFSKMHDKLFASDVILSKKLIQYTDNLTKLTVELNAVNDKYARLNADIRERYTELQQTNHYIAHINNDLEPKTQYNRVDIGILTERHKELKQVQAKAKTIKTDIKQGTLRLKELAAEAKTLNIKYQMQQRAFVNEIFSWINDKGYYYFKHKLPENKDDAAASLLASTKESQTQYNKLPLPEQTEIHTQSIKELQARGAALKRLDDHKPEILRNKDQQALSIIPLANKIKKDLTFTSKIPVITINRIQEDINNTVLRSM